jgi:hypothetical protein
MAVMTPAGAAHRDFAITNMPRWSGAPIWQSLYLATLHSLDKLDIM